MLGCHDFCGYYEWTFHYLRRRYGQAGVENYWAKAIAADSQQHYISAAKDDGLRGLHESWLKTGDDEKCDWSVTLDEANNLLRLDMRECPSKGFLLQNNLNADEDYCDHCMGWIGPALQTMGVEVAAHEHNHCGQCWWEIREADRSQPEVKSTTDIRQDARWAHGYLHRYDHHEKQPLSADSEKVDSCDLLISAFRDYDSIRMPWELESPENDSAPVAANAALILSGASYAAGSHQSPLVKAVILEHCPDLLVAIAERYHSVDDPPLLLHPYFPSEPMLDLVQHQLPRAVPILPLLIRTRLYDHSAWPSPPAFQDLVVMLASALGKPLCRA